jgi:Flp pilus assembly protein TadB
MKQYLIAIALMLALSLNAEAASQKHRHTARTEQVDSTKDNQDAIEAFSDTTSSSKEDAEDDQYITHRHRTTYTTSSDVKELKEVMESVGGIFGPMLAVGIVAFVVIFFLLPLLIIVTIIYFVNKNRKERYKLAQMAIQNGQPIPDDILKSKVSSSSGDNDYQTGVRQMFTGVGLAIFLGLIIGKVGIGIGALVFFIGLGKWFIYRQNNNTGNDDFLNHNNSNQFNNNSNVRDYE